MTALPCTADFLVFKINFQLIYGENSIIVNLLSYVYT